MDYFYDRKIDEFYIIYTIVRGNICEAKMEKLLPLDFLTTLYQKRAPIHGNMYEEFLMDPSPEAVLDNIVPNYVTGFIYGAMVESFCSVQQSRMMAMDNANKNAEQMMVDLKKSYNRQRQAMITQEITEVVSGAKALKRSKEVKKHGKR